MIDGYAQFEAILEGKTFAAGDYVSVADYSLLSSIGSIATLVPIDPEKFPRVTAWLQRVQARPECAVNKRGQDEFAVLFKSKLSKE